MELFLNLLVCIIAGAVGVYWAHLFYKYTDRRGWRGWDLG